MSARSIVTGESNVSVRDLKKRQLPDRTVVVLGGTSGIGLERARRARHAGADVILTARDADLPPAPVRPS
jgi:NADPH:quinone reductase-like Zn-dependent oxidoreductase